jgi:hypothetical protein
MDTLISHADAVDQYELDEELDPLQSSEAPEIVRTRYDRSRSFVASDTDGRAQSSRCSLDL